MINQLLSPAKALRTIRKTPAILAHVLAGLTQAQAEALRDGPDGWSILFVACHLRDYELIYRERIERMLAEDHPTFVVTPNDVLVERGAYGAQILSEVLADLARLRTELLARLSDLDDASWLRTGLHPQQGAATVLELAINVGLHDVDHTEQIVSCLASAS